MHKLLARQLAKATAGSGELDLQALLAVVAEAYEQSDNDRHRTDRSISLMIEELEQLNRGLDQLVQERTAALRQREAELQAQNLRFDAALKNMPHGLCMFDCNERLIVCNERYRRDLRSDARTDQARDMTTAFDSRSARSEPRNGPMQTDGYVEAASGGSPQARGL